MRRYVARVTKRAHHTVSVARDLMRMARAFTEWNRERRGRLQEERAALREVDR